MKVLSRIVLACLLLLATFPLQAEVKPASLFCDHMVLQRQKPIPVWGVAQPGEKVTVLFNSIKIKAKADAQGHWMVRMKAHEAGGPFNLEIRGKKNTVFIRDVYVGEVWFCSGQSNMDMTVAKENQYWCGVNNEAEEVASANYPLIRVFDVDYTPSEEVKGEVKGRWEVCSPQTVGHFSAVSYFFARELFDRYSIPFGMITSAYGASTAETWISKPALKARPNLQYLLDNYRIKWEKFVKDSIILKQEFRLKEQKYGSDLAAQKAAAGDVTAKAPKAPKNPDPSQDQHNPYVCYNGMVAPLFPYAVRGILWYQGESNGPSAREYREIMETLVADWRNAFQQGELPFLYVQLANYGKPMSKPVENGPMMTVREAQLQNLSIPNTAMVVAIDNAEDQPNNIHPKNKQEIGFRLALAARGKVYGEEVEYAGPMYDRYQEEGSQIRLFFKPNKEEFVAYCNSLTGFAIAGEDKQFYWANARFEGKTIVVWNPEVPKPVAVRYCWGTNPPASLANKDGLWAPNFKTDQW